MITNLNNNSLGVLFKYLVLSNLQDASDTELGDSNCDLGSALI